MQTCLYFVRHAHSVYSADEYGRPLSERGYQDAQRVTEILKTENINRILSSPYRRAIETVEGISRFLGIEIERKEDFKERVVASHPVEDFALAMAKLWGDEQFAWPGGSRTKRPEPEACMQSKGYWKPIRVKTSSSQHMEISWSSR